MIKGEPVESDVWVPFQLITPEQVAMFEQRYKRDVKTAHAPAHGESAGHARHPPFTDR